jgi:formylglycine-generating enzyme required for sulfatase activity
MRRNHRFAQMMILALSLSVALGTACARGSEAAPGSDAQPVAVKAKTIQNSIGMKLASIPAGTFLMGSPEPQPEKLKFFGKDVKWWKLIEGPQHKVTITKPFHIGTTEVTQGQWKAVMGNNSKLDPAGDNLPMMRLSWDDCQAFLGKLSRMEGRKYRLPTEAEWEYACRAGSTTQFSFGDDEAKLDEYAWHAKDNPKEFKVRPVGQKKPNAWGLYDVHGNAWEWCQDRYGKKYEAKDQVDPTGPAKDWGDRIMRGGALFYRKPTLCTSTCRNAYIGDYRMGSVGFRVVLASAEVVPVVKPTHEKPALSFEQRISSPKEKARLEKLGAVRNSLGMVMMPIPAGEFIMGTAKVRFESPPHKVKITKPYYLSATEVTQGQWKALMGSNPSYMQGDDLPADVPSWNACQEFVKKLSAKEGKTYRLPTEAEWEYACRAGSKTKFCSGDDGEQLGEYAWYKANSDLWLHPVGQKKPNAWGLYDMHGNVREWCQDRGLGAYSQEEQIDPTGATKGNQRVFRGGAWFSTANQCRSAIRDARHTHWGGYFGLRVVLVPSS